MAGMRLRRRLLWSAVTNWLAFAATLAVGFFLMPYLVRTLGNGPYGVWSFVESLLTYFTLFDLGIAACVVRFVARYHATDQRTELNKLVSTALALFLALGALMFALGAALLPLLLGAMTTVGIDRAEMLWFALLMLGNLALTLPLSVFPSILDGLERYAAKSAIRISMLAVRVVATVWVMEQRPSLLNLGLVITVTNIVEQLAFAWFVRRLLPDLQLARHNVDRATVRQVRGYSLDAFLAMLAGRISVQSGALIVGFLLGAAPVTYLAIVSRLVELAKALLRHATNTLTPAVSSLEAVGNFGAIRTMLLVGTRYVLYLIIPVQLGLMIFGAPFLDVWMKAPEYAQRCYSSLVVMSSILALVVAQSLAARILYGVGRLRWFARLTLLEATLNIVLSIWLGRSEGILGVALGVTIPNFLMNLWVIGYTLRYLHLSLGTYLRESWGRPLVATCVLPIMWLLPGWPINDWLMLATALAAGLLPYGMLVLTLEDKWPRRRWQFPMPQVLVRSGR